MYRIMCDRIWEKKMKFGCCKLLRAVVNWNFETEACAAGAHPCWKTRFCFPGSEQEARAVSSSLHSLLIVR